MTQRLALALRPVQVIAGLLLLLMLGLGTPLAQMAPASRTETLDQQLLYLPLMMRNKFEPIIAFATKRDGNFEIYVLNPRSMSVRNVTGHSGEDMAPALGPGGMLAWASTRDGNWEIYTGDIYGRNVRRLTFDSGIDYGPTWSPDGRRIAFTSGRSGSMDIWAMEADGTGNPVRLTTDPSQQRQPAWSPDGRKIAYVSDQDGNDNIYVMNADGSGQQRLRDLASSDEQFPSWSADSTWVIFTTDVDGPHELYAINVEQLTLQPVTTEPVFDVEPSWSADGKRVVFRSTRDGNTDLYLINFDGSGLGTGLRRLTTHEADDMLPAWSR